MIQCLEFDIANMIWVLLSSLYSIDKRFFILCIRHQKSSPIQFVSTRIIVQNVHIYAIFDVFYGYRYIYIYMLHTVVFILQNMFAHTDFRHRSTGAIKLWLSQKMHAWLYCSRSTQNSVFVGSTRVHSNMLHLHWINQTDTARPTVTVFNFSLFFSIYIIKMFVAPYCLPLRVTME